MMLHLWNHGGYWVEWCWGESGDVLFVHAVFFKLKNVFNHNSLRYTTICPGYYSAFLGTINHHFLCPVNPTFLGESLFGNDHLVSTKFKGWFDVWWILFPSWDGMGMGSWAEWASSDKKLAGRHHRRRRRGHSLRWGLVGIRHINKPPGRGSQNRRFCDECFATCLFSILPGANCFLYPRLCCVTAWKKGDERVDQCSCNWLTAKPSATSLVHVFFFFLILVRKAGETFL
jgi:hypothetical protein